MIEKREVEKDGAIIQQARYSDYGHTTEWIDVARIYGDTRPRFFYGKSWRQHVEGK